MIYEGLAALPTFSDFDGYIELLIWSVGFIHTYYVYCVCMRVYVYILMFSSGGYLLDVIHSVQENYT